MPKLVLEDLPPDVLQRLEDEARTGERKLSDVATARLIQSVRDSGLPHARPSSEELLRLADSVRTGCNEAWFTPEFIRMAREDGRA